MRNMWIIAKKEYISFYHSPIAYVIGVVTFLTLGIFFWLQIDFAVQTQQFVPDIRNILAPILSCSTSSNNAYNLR